MNDDLTKTEGGDGGNLDLINQSDQVLLARAIKRRWPISDAMKARMVEQLGIQLGMAESARDFASLAKVVVAMEGQNQTDERAVVGDETKDALMNAAEVVAAMRRVTVPGKRDGEE